MLRAIMRRLNLDSTKIAIAGLLLLLILVGIGNLLATYNAVDNFRQSQRQAGQVFEQKICVTFAKLGALKLPPNEQALHDTLVELGADVGCPPRAVAR